MTETLMFKRSISFSNLKKFVSKNNLNITKLGFIIISFSAALVLIFSAIRMFRMINIDYNEGWNAYHTDEFMRGLNVYFSDMTPVNYPPLSFLIVGFLNLLVDNYILSGRILAYLSLLITAFFVGIIVKKKTDNIGAALLSALCMVCIFGISALGYIGMDDPQLFGHALQLVGLYLFLMSKFSFSGILFGLSLFGKHTLVALPISLVFYSFVQKEKRILSWLLSLLIVAIFSVIIISMYSHGNFISQILWTREYGLRFWLGVSPRVIVLTLPIFIVLALSNSKVIQKNNSMLPTMYLFTSFIIGNVTAAASGTDVNMFFDLLISLSWLIGLAWKDMRRKVVRKALIITSLALYFLLLIGYRVRPEKWKEIKTLENITKQDVNLLASYSDPVLCDSISLCFWSKKEFVYDPFLMGEAIVGNEVIEGDVLSTIKQKRFSIIQLDRWEFDNVDIGSNLPGERKRQGRFTRDFFEVLTENYVPLRTSSNGIFYTRIESN